MHHMKAIALGILMTQAINAINNIEIEFTSGRSHV